MAALQGLKADILRFQNVPLRLWDLDRPFSDAWKYTRGRTLIDPIRGYVLWQLAGRAASLPGCFAELGVYKGGSAYLLAARLGKQTLHLFDTFKGMPEPDPKVDLHAKGNFSDTSAESVLRFLGRPDRVKIHEGLFPNTASGLESERWSLVHVDADLYRSVLDACVFFWPGLIPGGAMVFDDYGFASCPGAKKAVDEFFPARTDSTGLYLPTGQYLAFKVPP